MDATCISERAPLSDLDSDSLDGLMSELFCDPDQEQNMCFGGLGSFFLPTDLWYQIVSNR